MGQVKRIGLDTAKHVFQVHAVDPEGKPVATRRLRRTQLLAWFAQVDRAPDCVVGLEATGAAHYWARSLTALGYRVRLLPAQVVKGYRQGQKTDVRDAAAICDATGQVRIAAAIKSEAQQAILAQQAYRQRLVAARTALGNQLRGLAGESGVAIGRGWSTLKRRLAEVIEDADNDLAWGLRTVLAEGYDELLALERRLLAWDRQLAAQARADARCRRLMAIPGIGPLTALRLVAICEDGTPWRNARAFGVSVGLTPRQHSSGDRVRLGPITRWGDTQLRTLLIHGARAVLARAQPTTPQGRWLLALQQRRHRNVAAVALAHKNARIAWALLAHGTEYRPATDAVAA